MGLACSRGNDADLEELPLQMQVEQVLAAGRARGLAWPPGGGGDAPARLNVYGAREPGAARHAFGLAQPRGAEGGFHCGVEVHNCEWSYGSEERQWGFDWNAGKGRHPTGITCAVPRDRPDYAFCEFVVLGRTLLSQDDVLRIIQRLGRSWAAVDYDPLTRSCLHFSDALCQLLGVGGVPDQVRRLAEEQGGGAAGCGLGCCEPRALCACPAAAAPGPRDPGHELDALRRQLEQATVQLRRAQRDLACERASHDEAVRQVFDARRGVPALARSRTRGPRSAGGRARPRRPGAARPPEEPRRDGGAPLARADWAALRGPEPPQGVGGGTLPAPLLRSIRQGSRLGSPPHALYSAHSLGTFS